MKSGRLSPSLIWNEINQLGDCLLEKKGLDEQCSLITRTAAALLSVKTKLWLDERLFRLPGLNQKTLFPPDPPRGVMRQAYETRKICFDRGNHGIVALPMHSQDQTIGVLLAQKQEAGNFHKTEIAYLETLTGHAALALIAAHRFAVEQWRVEQLTLVREVNSQIAKVLDPAALARQVTRLILETFKYYYVAIFTLSPGERVLSFWSSASADARGRSSRSKRIRVELGQGLIGEAAASGVEIVSNVVSREPRFRQLEHLPGTRSEVVLPLKIGSDVLGVLDIQSDRLDAFHPNDLLVLRALADTIAIAVNNSRLFGDVKKRASQLSIITEVSKDITSVLELDELLHKVAVLIQERLQFPYVSLFSVHHNRRRIIYEAGSGLRSESLQGYSIGLDDSAGLIPWVARNGRSVLCNDVSREPRYRPSPFPPENTRSELTIPLLYNHQPVGVLDLQSNRLNAFSEDDRFLLESLADSIAVAIHNADLFRTERWRRQVADSVREVAGLLAADAGVDDVLDSVLRELQRSLPCDIAAVWLLEGDEFYLAHIHGAEIVETEAAMQRWPEAKSYLMAALEASQPIIRQPTDPFDPAGIAHGFAADYSSIAVAMRVGDHTLGVLTLSHQTSGRYGHEAQAITATFASYAAVAIENARLYDSAQEQAYASAALLQVAQTVVHSNNLQETIGSIVRITPILVGVKACTILLWEGERFHTTQSYGFPDEVQPLFLDREFLPQEFPLLEAVHTTREMVIGVLAAGLPEEWLDPVLAGGKEEELYALQTSEHLLIGMPLIIRNDFYGVLLVQEEAESRRFRQKRIEIVNGIAQQIAMSIENDRLQSEMVARERLEHEVQLARQIQRTFLPDKLPEFKEWELAATWRTARQVGGDFYDIFELPGERLGLLIADVSDKGIPAALFMALTRTLVRAAVLDADSPAEVLRRVNALIIPDNREEMFVTAVYGVLSLQTGQFTYVNAGHNPPLWMAPEKESPESLPRTAAALGIIENMEIQERTIHLGARDSLLFYTDGVTEAFSPQDEIFGVERLEELMASAGELSARALLNMIEDSTQQFMGTNPAADDLTMLAVRCKKAQ